MAYSQNNEEAYILNYFKGKTGALLDIGANDGKTFSNSLALIELGWKAHLVEPNNEAMILLYERHKDNPNVDCYPVAISTVDGVAELHTNEPHITGDVGLLSTLNEDEKKRWGALPFGKQKVETLSFATFYDLIDKPVLDFITIDAEGLDLAILRQIDLTDTQMVCVEHNGKDVDLFTEYCRSYGMQTHHINSENIIFIR